MGECTMRIFGLVITTQKQFKEEIIDAYNDGRKRGISIGEHAIKTTNFAWINPVIHDLEKLRANTWDQDKITHMQKWLKGAIEVDE